MNRIEKLLEFLEVTPDDHFLKHALALEYMKLGKNKEARDLFEKILNEQPDFLGSYYQLGKLLEENGETKNAIYWYEKGMEAAKRTGDIRSFNELKSAYEELIF